MSDLPKEPDPNEPLSQETLADLLKKHKEEKDAIIGEFTDASNNNESVTEENAKKRIVEIAPDAFTALKHLVNNADSESVRNSAAKYILDVTLNKKKLDDDPTSEMNKLIESLKPKATKTPVSDEVAEEGEDD